MALTTNLIAYYSMNGNSNDAVGSNNGSDSNITYSSGNGIIPNGAGFNGSSSFINYSAWFSGTGDCSWQFWIKTTQTSQANFFNQRDSTSPPYGQWNFSINNTGTNDHKLSFFDYDGNGGAGAGFDWSSTGTPSINDGSWHHVIFTKSGTSGLLYIDAVLNLSPTAAKNVSYSLSGGMGRDKRDNIQYLNGALDEIGLWTRVLTSTEVTQLYNGGAGLAYPLVVPSGPTNVKTFDGVTQSTGIKTYLGVALSSTKSVDGIT